MSLHADAVRVLAGWRAPDDGQELLRESYLAHLADHPDGMWKSGPPAHLTASCLVLDPSGTRTLLVHHAKGGFWVQPGGHCERDDPSLAAAAAREAREEVGVPGLQLLPEPVQLDRHALSSAFGRCTDHLDVRFLAVAPSNAVPVTSAESHAARWFDVADLPPTAVSDLGRALGHARRALARR